MMSRGNTAFLFRASYPANIGRTADSFRGLYVEPMLNGHVHHFRFQSLSSFIYGCIKKLFFF